MMANYDNPLISVITVCFNSANTIGCTIQSVIAQSYRNFEYVIIDGKSTDNTLAVIEQYRPLLGDKLRVISEKDTGIYNAMNKGIRSCRGEIIGILNSDDYYSEDTLQLVAEKYAQERYPLLVINGDMIRVAENGEPIYVYRFTEDQVQRKQCFGHPSMFAAREVYNEIGLYDESYRLAADGDWQYRALENEKVRYVLCHEVFNHMREGGASDNPKYRWKWFRERSRMKLSHNRGSRVQIYWQELKSVLRTDIKAIIPRERMRAMYSLRYGGKTKCNK